MQRGAVHFAFILSKAEVGSALVAYIGLFLFGVHNKLLVRLQNNDRCFTGEFMSISFVKDIGGGGDNDDGRNRDRDRGRPWRADTRAALR